MIYGLNEDPSQYTLLPLVVHPSQMMNKKIIYVRYGSLLVYGSFQPYHLSHMLMNALIPIESTLQKIPQQYSNVHVANVGRTLQSDAKYAFPIDFMGFEKQFATVYFKPGAVDPYFSMPVFDGVTLKKMKDVTYCYPLGILGVDGVCSRCFKEPTKEVYESLKQKVLKHYNIEDKVIQKRVLIVQRRETRKIVNLPKIISVVNEFSKDHQVVFLEDLTFPEQIKLFVECSILIAPHGNGNSHIHWMRNGTVFIEGVGLRRYGEGFYGPLSRQKRIYYYSLPCSMKGCKESQDPRDDDVYMDPEAVRKILKNHIH